MNDWEKKLLEALEQMPVDSTFTLTGPKGWMLEIKKLSNEGAFGHRAFNPGPDGARRFYETNCYAEISPYGAPIILQEPDDGIPCRDCGIDQDGEIVGMLVYDEELNLLTIQEATDPLRFSNSKLKKSWGLSLEVTQEGEVMIAGKSVGFINLLHQPDKNRMKGWVAHVLPIKPKEVEIMEMEAIGEILKLRLRLAEAIEKVGEMAMKQTP